MSATEINSAWIELTGKMADLFEEGLIDISRFSEEQLQYLIYFNWGYSGRGECEQTKSAKKELTLRNQEFNLELAEKIVIETENFL